jgi:hypothetical protein
MSARRRRMVIVCVDGGLPGVVRQHDFFNLTRRFPALAGSAVHDLTSIYPSSTAPAHASFLTGSYPAQHGIVGNRYWERESSAEIRSRADKPLSAIHPYEWTSLTAPSLLEWFAEHHASVAAVHFPQTFSRSRACTDVPGCYCLYAPARELLIDLAHDGPVPNEGVATLCYADHDLRLRARAHHGGAAATIGAADGAELTTLAYGRPARLDLAMPMGSLSVAVTADQPAPDRLRLSLGTAVITLGFGGLDPHPASPGEGPASLLVEYTADPRHDFHEAPRAEWVERIALETLDRHDPDVLFVRFNQADHAQEYLYWHAVRGTPVERRLAWQQILDAYTRIDACTTRLAEAVGEGAEFLFFSDHGIDYVETHLRPNRLLADLGLDDRMVFQGDSNCAYLYTDAALRPSEERRLHEGLRALDPTVTVLDRAGLERLGLPPDSPRVGGLTVSCGPHIEFQYGESAAREQVASASHGYLPACPAMKGFLRGFGSTAAWQNPPSDLTGAALVIRKIWRHMSRGE